jgi:hypothetical protein
MSVIILPKVLDYFEYLVLLLYQKEYFSYLETSKQYVEELLDDVKTTLPNRLHKPAPLYFDRYGKDMKYAAFKKSKHTTWYAFFKTYNMGDETVFLIRYIANNHIIAQYL